MRFHDHFSGHAASYTRFRPGYPCALFEFLAGLSPARSCAWDCATGSGQAAVPLAAHFLHVIATDASSAQIAHATAHPAVSYAVMLAEQPALCACCVDLVTVAQALHWFDLDAFYGAVRRILRPGGVIAAWCYGLMRITPAIDAIVDQLYDGILGPCWPAERCHIDAGYRDLAFPFAEVQAPALRMQADWRLDQVKGYIATWSAVQRHVAAGGGDPLADIDARISDAWGDPLQIRAVTWPFTLRAGFTRRRRNVAAGN